jgi:acylphosphatase
MSPDRHTVAYLVTYRGSVQGVGFRFTVVRFAHAHDHVTGWVRNNPDGSVAMHVQGPVNEVEMLLGDIAGGPHRSYIRDVTTQPCPPNGALTGFGVKY